MKQNCRPASGLLRKALALLLLAALLCPLCPAASADVKAVVRDSLESYLPWNAFTMQDLFDAAGEALENGMDAKQVLEEMAAVAEEREASDWLTCAAGNLAAADSPETQEMKELLSGRKLSVAYEHGSVENEGLRYRIYDTPDASEEVKALFADVSGHACLEPAYWAESDFSTVFGKKLTLFKPAEPRPGHVCIVLRDSSQSAPETPWDQGDREELEETMGRLVQDLGRLLDEDGPVLTGNPQLASEFWIVEIRYVYHGEYGGQDWDRFIKGYDCAVSVTAQNAADHKKIAELSWTEVLPEWISGWNRENWTAQAKIPDVDDSEDFRAKCEAFAGTVRPGIRQQRSAAEASGRITSLNAEKKVNALLVRQTEKLKDAWQNAIYQGGVKNISVEEDTLTFSLRGYDPKVKELGAFASAEDPEAWLKAALANAAEYSLEISLPLQDGQVPQKGVNALRNAVQKAAASARTGFSGRDMTAALKAYLFPVPVSGTLKDSSQILEPSEEFSTWYARHADVFSGTPEAVAAAALALLKSQSLNVSNGPHALVFTCVGGKLDDIVAGSRAKIVDAQAYLPASARSANGDPAEILRDTLAQDTVAAAKKAAARATLTVDIDDLAEGVMPAEYRAYFRSFDWESEVGRLKETLSLLPDEAAQPVPQNGRLSGLNSGTKVVFRAGDQTEPTYLIMRDEATGQIAVSAMLHPKMNVTVNVPEGRYEIAWCSGPYWYGTKKLFGALGSYSKSEIAEIKDKRYVHYYTLKTAAGEGLSVYGADQSDFQ